MDRQVFTLEEANALVPRVALLMQQLQQAALQIQSEAEAHVCAAGGAVADVSPRDLVARALIAQLDTAMESLTALGVEVKDLRLGLCDFPSWHEGELVYLCWQTGEPAVGYWHPIDEGFSSRRPLANVRGRGTLLQ